MSPSEYPILSEIVADKTLKYLYFMDRNHPIGDSKGRVWHHRHVASVKIGRWLMSHEVVHHVDGDRQNNLPENLVVVSSNTEHMRLHHPQHPCPICGKMISVTKFCSRKCSGEASQRVAWPDDEWLQQMVLTTPYTKIGAILGVSDVAVKKMAAKRGLQLFNGPRNKK